MTLLDYYSRFDPAKNFEEHLFRSGYVLQSSEINEIQQAGIYRDKQFGDALFKDGDIIRDARIVVNQSNGDVTCESGAIYLRGAVRGVPDGTLNIPTIGTVAVGIILTESIVTEITDASLNDPAAGTRNYNEPGAARLKVDPSWGFQTTDSSNNLEFFPVYYIEDGVQRAKEPPPQLDSVTQAIARYDRDSAGSNYVVNGLIVSKMNDDGINQVYNIESGRARVNGFGIELNTSVRLNYPANPELKFISNEPKTSTTVSSQRINVDRPPISNIQQVSITKETSTTIVHGSFSGAQDPIPDTSVISIESVTQGATTYILGTDYQLTAGKVDWSLPGAEPAPGSTFNIIYRHITDVTPVDVDDTGFTIANAVVGTLVLTDYNTKLPRIDRLCLDESGQFIWVKGVSTDYSPVRPATPNNLIALAQVVQTWTNARQVLNDGVRAVSMSSIEQLFFRLDAITDLVAQQKLSGDITQRESSAQKGLFVDPFLDDLQRDQGISQTAAISNGVLTLPIDGEALDTSISLSNALTCGYTLEPILQQELRTGGMKINPYMAFGLLPAGVQLNPAIDRWTEVNSVWLSPITQRFVEGWGNRSSVTTTASTQLVKTTSSLIQNLRQIDVGFKISGFGPGEVLNNVIFDGISVTANPL
jgi:hypothetical protein